MVERRRFQYIHFQHQQARQQFADDDRFGHHGGALALFGAVCRARQIYLIVNSSRSRTTPVLSTV